MALPVVCVEESIADELVEAVVELGKNLKMGPAWESTTELGPLVTEDHRRFVLDWIEKGVAEGAKLVLDGRNPVVPGCENGYFVGATVFDHVEPDMRVGIDEIFGPVLCIERVSGFEEGLEVANSSEFRQRLRNLHAEWVLLARVREANPRRDGWDQRRHSGADLGLPV